MIRLLLRLGGSLLVDFLVWGRNVLVGKEGSRFKENLLSYLQLMCMKHYYKKISGKACLARDKAYNKHLPQAWIGSRLRQIVKVRKVLGNPFQFLINTC